jgi:hypothetical protein
LGFAADYGVRSTEFHVQVFDKEWRSAWFIVNLRRPRYARTQALSGPATNTPCPVLETAHAQGRERHKASDAMGERQVWYSVFIVMADLAVDVTSLGTDPRTLDFGFVPA